MISISGSFTTARQSVAAFSKPNLPGRLFHCALIAAAERAHFNFRRQLEKAWRLAPRIGVRLAHEAVADQADPRSLRHAPRTCLR